MRYINLTYLLTYLLYGGCVSFRRMFGGGKNSADPDIRRRLGSLGVMVGRRSIAIEHHFY